MPERESSRPRAFWSGTITFGLVTIPVDLHPANRTGGAHWRMLDAEGAPLRRRYYCPAHEREVEADELVRGYEIAEGEHVVVTDEELESLEPRKSRDIDLRAFVDADQLDPRYFERSYFLTPAKESTKAYRLLAEALETSGRAGVATFVMREREYLVAILSERGVLRAETMRFHDEVRKPQDVGLGKLPRPDAKRVAAIRRVIEPLRVTRLDRRLLKDTYAQDVARLLKSHEAETVRVKPAGAKNEADDVPDLMAALKRSLRAGSRSRGAAARSDGSRARSRGAVGTRKRARSKASSKASAARRPRTAATRKTARRKAARRAKAAG